MKINNDGVRNQVIPQLKGINSSILSAKSTISAIKIPSGFSEGAKLTKVASDLSKINENINGLINTINKTLSDFDIAERRIITLVNNNFSGFKKVASELAKRNEKINGLVNTIDKKLSNLDNAERKKIVSANSLPGFTGKIVNSAFDEDKIEARKKRRELQEYEEKMNKAIVDALNNKDVEKATWLFLSLQGFDDVHVASILGNLKAESGLSPEILEQTKEKVLSELGIGLAQWTSEERKDGLEKYTESQGKEWTDAQSQLEYLYAEITGKGPAAEYAIVRTEGHLKFVPEKESNREEWLKATDLKEATKSFMYYFESPKDDLSEKYRINSAKEYHEKFTAQQVDISDKIIAKNPRKKKKNSESKEIEA